MVFEALSKAGYRVDLLLQVVARLHHTWRRRALVADQLYTGGIKVLHVVLLVGFSMGMVVSLQTGLELARIGQQDQIVIERSRSDDDQCATGGGHQNSQRVRPGPIADDAAERRHEQVSFQGRAALF